MVSFIVAATSRKVARIGRLSRFGQDDGPRLSISGRSTNTDFVFTSLHSFTCRAVPQQVGLGTASQIEVFSPDGKG
jgi:hypothetical protein